MAAMIDSLLKNDLKKSLTKTYFQNISYMLAHTEKYVYMREAFVEEISANFDVACRNKKYSPR